MQLINSQYRIMEILQEDKYGTKFLAEDIHNENLIKIIRLIEKTSETEAFIEHLKVNFFDYTNLIHPNIYKIYYFNKIKAIDARPVISNKFYYTYENIEGQNLFEYAKGKDTEELLELCVQLLSAFKYLHLRGFIYCSINPEDIFVTIEEGKARVKIASFPYSLYVGKRVIINKENSYFKAPEALQNGRYDKSTDIYLLGIIIYHIFTGDDIKRSSFGIYNPKATSPPEMIEIFKIIEKCTATCNYMRYSSIDEIIKDINKAFNKNYTVIHKKYIETLPGKPTKLVARENIIKRLIGNIKGCLYGGSPIKLSAITGDYGTGKGALLEAFIARLGFEGEHTSYVSLNEDNKEDYYGIKTIIKNIFKYAEKELVDKYFDQLSDLIPELVQDKTIKILTDKVDDDDRITYRLGNFILEVSLNRPFVIIIKNFEYLDEKSKKIINYMLTKEDMGKVCMIVSFHEEVLEDQAKDYLKINLGNIELDVITLPKYDISHTAEAIKIQLAMDYPPGDFALKVFEETDGNPSLVHEMIYALFLDKHIYVDDTGKWVLDKVDFSKVHLSVDIIETIQNKIRKLDPINKYILDVLSIFNIDIPMDILRDMCGIDTVEILPLLENLISLNVLSRRTNARGVHYSYNSVGLKKAVYNDIANERLISYHEKASIILEEKLDFKKEENINELIHQMSKGGRAKEAIEYLVILAKDLVEKNLYRKAIKSLERGLLLFENNSTCKRKAEISIQLGDLYYKIGKYNESLHCYKIAETMVSGDMFLLADIYVKNIYGNYKLNDIKKCLNYSQKAKKLIRENNYKKGLLDLILALSDLLIYRRKTGTVIKIVEKVLKELNTQERYYYGMFMSVYGKALLKRCRYEEAMEVLFESAAVLEELNEYEGLVVATNAIGAIYCDYYNEYKKAGEYFEKTLVIAQRINNITHTMLSYINLGEIYKKEEMYSKCMVYLNKALNLAEYYPNIYTKAILHNNAAMIYMEMENYIKYIEFMEKGKEVIFDTKDTGEVLNHYYSNEAVFYYIMGMFGEAEKNAKKSIEISESWGISIDSHVALVNILCEMKLNDTINTTKLMRFCISLFDSKSYKVGRLACHKIAELYIDKKDYDKAKDFLSLSANYKETVDTPGLNLVYRYLSILAEADNDKAGLLTRLIKEYNYIDNNEIKWKIYKTIGESQVDGGDLFGGLKNLITSFNHLKLLMDGVPKDYKINFLQSHGRNKIKDSLMSAAQKITGQKGLVHSLVPITGNEEDIVKEINEYFDYKKFKNLVIRNDNTKSRKGLDFNKSMLGKFLLDLFDRIDGFGIDIEDNIKKLVEAFMGFTQAKNGLLAIIDENNEIQMLYSDAKDENNKFYRYMIEKVRKNSESIIITDVYEYKKKANEDLIPKDLAGVFCIPIVASDNEESIKKERRKGSSIKEIKGYLYLDTDSIINNFTEETADLCEKVTKIAYVLIDNYNLRMVNAFDKLTKLYTRKYFENALSNALAKGETFSVVMADIDRFKTINDKHGHQAGDEVLAILAEIILKNLRKTDICARYGGEEFIMLLPYTDTEGAFQLAEKIRERIGTARFFSHHSPITISMGIAAYPNHSTWGKDLIDKADQALYYSKETGRNKTKIYDENMLRFDRRINKLAGIVDGDMEEDIIRVENIIEMLEVQRNEYIEKEEKTFEFLGKAIKMSGAEAGSIFLVDENSKPIKQISKRDTSQEEAKDMSYNNHLLLKCIHSKTGEYLIDWSKSVEVDAVTGMPVWQSVIVIPVTNYGKVNAILYLSVSLKNKEFEASTYNYIKTLCDIAAPIFL